MCQVNSINFRQINVNENCSNLQKHDMLHEMEHTQKRYADAGYLGRVKMVLTSCVGGSNLEDSANIRKARKKLMIQVSTRNIHISNRYKFKYNLCSSSGTGSFQLQKRISWKS